MTPGNSGQGCRPVGKSAPEGVCGKKRIGEMLIEAGLVSDSQLREALAAQVRGKTKTVETLIALGYVTPDAFLHFLAKQPGIASIDLSNYEIPSELVSLIPREIAVRHEVFPVDRLGKLLTVGMVCPLDSATIQALESVTGLRIKPLLCSPGDIRAAIGRYYREAPAEMPHAVASVPAPQKPRPPAQEETTPKADIAGLESPLRVRGIAILVREIHSLPLLSQTVQKVQQSMQDPANSVRDIAAIIAQDPAVTGNVLRVANSAAYGFSRRIEDIALAVSLLGLREVYSIVLSGAIFDPTARAKDFDYATFLSHSVQTASAARIIGRALGKEGATSCFSAGLLHDIGCLVLARIAPDRYARVPQDLWGLDLIAAEERELGLSHTEAGYELSLHWNLPDGIGEPIRFHHHPERATQENKRVAIVAVANRMARVRQSNMGEVEKQFEGLEESLALLGLDHAALDGLFTEFDEVLANTTGASPI